jgi:hypothetical protein
MELPSHEDMSRVKKRHESDMLKFGMECAMRQEECVAAATRNPGLLIFAYDLKPGEQFKGYGYGGIEGFWRYYRAMIDRETKNIEKIANNEPVPKHLTHLMHHYEIIKTCEWMDYDVKRKYPCNIVLDIDVNIDHYHYCLQKRTLTSNLTFEQMVSIIIDKCAYMLEQLYGFTNVKDSWDLIQLDSSEYICKRKFSRHVIIGLPDDAMFASWADVAAFARRVILLIVKEYGLPIENPFFTSNKKHDPYDCIMDFKIFTNFRCMRFVGSSKLGEMRPLRELRNGRCMPIDTITEDFFRRCLVQYIRNPHGLVRPLRCVEWDGTEACYSSSHFAFQFGELLFPIEDISDLGCGPENPKKRRKYELQRIIMEKSSDNITKCNVAERSDEWKEHMKSLFEQVKIDFVRFYGYRISSMKWTPGRSELRLELDSRMCPYNPGREHENNHIRYHISFTKFDEPFGWFKCYKCEGRPGYSRGPIPFKNNEMDIILDALKHMDDQMSQKSIAALFPVYAATGLVIV